jgi:tight adherence protein B
VIARILAAAALLAVTATAASAAGELDLHLLDAQLETDGSTTLVVSVRGDEAEQRILEAADFSVTENGEPISGLETTPLLETEHTAISVLLLIDTSGSTQGAPLQNAKTAGAAFADSLTDKGIDVGLVEFGPAPTVITPFTTNAGPLTSGLNGLEAAGETALYDAVVLGASELERRDGQRHLVVFSDGADTVSSASLGAAVAAVEAVAATTSVVALETPDLDPAALQQLADRTDGDVVSAQNAAALTDAFDTVARSIASQYVLTYVSEVVDPNLRELDVAIGVIVAGATATQVATLTNPRLVSVAELPAVELAQPTFLQRPEALGVGLGAAFLALVGLLVIATSSVTSDAGSRTLRRSLRIYTTGGTRDRETSTAARLSTRAGEVVDRLPKPKGLERKIQEDLDRAAWPLRASEFMAIQIALAAGGALLGFALVGNALFGLLLGGMAAAVARVVLTRRVTGRQADFLTQLPDTLGLLASSLKAGYGLVQAIDTVVKEAPEPTASEFARALTEIRLGRPLEEALDAMAERLGSEDFAWVVMAINVQNEVGGNLAELLTTVAGTLRERVQVQRQIRVLSAEGRLSALVLILLPILLAAYMAVVSPDYLALLFGTFAGRMMVLGAFVFGIIGVFWMRRVVDIDV